MIKINSPGRPLELTDDIIKRIVDVIPESFTPTQVARLAKIPQTTLTRWLNTGKNDSENGNETIFSHLWLQYEHKKGEVIKKILITMLSKNTFQAYSWVLERCFPEDFGINAGIIAELIEQHKVIKDKLGLGDSHAREMDTKGDQTSRFPQENSSC